MNSVDFENGYIKIENTVVKNLTIIESNKTKTAHSQRNLVMLPDVKEMLLLLRKQQEDNKEFYGNEYNINDYVFKTDVGKLYRPDSVTKTFKNVLKKHNIPEMRFHDLRHSTCTILRDLGWSAETRMQWLGHADIDTTVDVSGYTAAGGTN